VPELFGIRHPDSLADIHRQYIEAGSDIIQSNTFGGSSCKLAEYGLEGKVREINAKRSVLPGAPQQGGLVAASIGPTGKMLAPMGEATFDELYQLSANRLQPVKRPALT
jgi:5-methyltetrahydrofolate--homocysteine methyltransferase